MVENIFTQFPNSTVTDGQTDRQTPHNGIGHAVGITCSNEAL